MKIARAIRPKRKEFLTEKELQRLLECYGIKDKGVTKSGEKLLQYKHLLFTLPREELEGYKLDAAIDKIAKAIARVELDYPDTKPKDPAKEAAFLHRYEELKKKLKQTKFSY